MKSAEHKSGVTSEGKELGGRALLGGPARKEGVRVDFFPP